jgi:hypothetical protein
MFRLVWQGEANFFERSDAMVTSKYARAWIIGSLSAAALGALSGSAWAQARTTPSMSDCMTPQNAMQNQQCSTQRQPQYTTDGQGPSGPAELRDNRLNMSLDNGGGGTQSPVVPNTTGAPTTSGAAVPWN